MRIKHPISALWRNNRGAALIEFIIVLPLFLFLVVAAAEFYRFLLINIKVQNASYAMAQVVSQYNPANTWPAAAGEVSYDTLVNALGADGLKNMLSPFVDASSQQGVIITSIRNRGGVKRIEWQIVTTGNMDSEKSIVNQKSIGAIKNYDGFTQNLSTTFDAKREAIVANMLNQENMIVVEVFYFYEPLFTPLFNAIGVSAKAFAFAGIAPRTITRQTFLQPRFGDSRGLVCLPTPTDAPAPPDNHFLYSADCPGVSPP